MTLMKGQMNSTKEKIKALEARNLELNESLNCSGSVDEVIVPLL